MEIKIPSDIRYILCRLEQGGFEAFISGRELCSLMLGKNISSCVVTTNASVDNIKSIFPKTVENNGRINIVHNGIGYNIRLISRGETIEDLCSRAEFSVNSMAYSQKNGLVDIFGAASDIENKLIRVCRKADELFTMRPLTMLRAVSLCAILGFELEEETKRSIKKYAAMIKRVRYENLLADLNKILLSPNPDSIRILNQTMLLRFIMPQLSVCFGEPQKNKYHIYDVGEHIMHAVKNVRCDKILRWAALLHDIGKPATSSTDENGIIHFYGHHKESTNMADGILHRLRMDSDDIRDILILIENHDVRIEPSVPAVKRMLSKTGPELFLKLLELQLADNKAKNMSYFEAKRQKIEAARNIYNEVVAAGEPYLPCHLVISSRELARIGFKKGRMMSDVLKSLLNEVIINPSLNNREYLTKRARQIKNRNGV